MEYQFMPKCLVKQLSGLSCPACGIQRALHAFLHGDFGAAIRQNYFLVIALPYALCLFVSWLLPPSPFKKQLDNIAEHPTVVRLFVASFLAWFIIRNLFGI